MNSGNIQGFYQPIRHIYIGEITSNVNYVINIMKESQKYENTLIITHTLSVAEQLQIIYAHDQLEPQNIVDSEMFNDNMLTEQITDVIIILGDEQLKTINVLTYLLIHKQINMCVITSFNIYNNYLSLSTQFVTIRCYKKNKPLEINKYYLSNVSTFSDNENDCIRLTLLTHMISGRIGHSDSSQKSCKYIILAPGRLQKTIGRLFSDLQKRFVIVSDKDNSLQKVAQTIQFIKQKEIQFLILNEINYALAYILNNLKQKNDNSKGQNQKLQQNENTAGPKISLQWVICGFQSLNEPIYSFMQLCGSDVVWLSSGEHERLNVDEFGKQRKQNSLNKTKQFIFVNHGFKSLPIEIPAYAQKLTENALEPVLREIMTSAYGSYVGGAVKSIKWDQLLPNEKIHKYLGPKVPEATFYLLSAQKGKLQRFCLITDFKASKQIIQGLNDFLVPVLQEQKTKAGAKLNSRMQKNDIMIQSVQHQLKRDINQNQASRPRWHDATQYENGWEFSRRAIATSVCEQLLNAGRIYYIAPAHLLPRWPSGSIWAMSLGDEERDLDGFIQTVDDLVFQVPEGSIVIFQLSDPRRSEARVYNDLNSSFKYNMEICDEKDCTKQHRRQQKQTDSQQDNSQIDSESDQLEDDETGKQIIDRALYLMNADIDWAKNVFIIVFA